MMRIQARATMRVACGWRFLGRGVGVELAGPGTCSRALCAKQVIAFRARLFAAHRK